VDIEIRGLVLTSGVTSTGGTVPANVVGTNPVPMVRIAVSWMVPGATPVFITETASQALDANGNLSAKKVPLGATPPANAERPIVYVRAGATAMAGPSIATSDFVADFGAARRHHDDD
jgi:hypothetical protein